jgi:ligand-binding sensor protein
MKITLSSPGNMQTNMFSIDTANKYQTVRGGEGPMNLVDIMPIENWIAIEKEINIRSGLNAAVYDVNGLRITDFKKWANRLCPSLRATEKGQQFICAVAHQNIAARAVKTKKTIVAECDAGLMKFAVPIFVGDEFLGAAGGCGLLNNQGQVDTYLVHKTTDMDEADIRNLAEDIESIAPDRLADVVDFVEKKVAESIQQFITEKQQGTGSSDSRR